MAKAQPRSMRKSSKAKRPDQILKACAAALKKQSPGMSLRAVAGRLGISAGYWSKILNGQKPIPQSLLPQIVNVLGLDPLQLAELQRSILQTIESEQLAPATGLHVGSSEPLSEVEGYRDLGRPDFWILEDWYFLPILIAFSLDDETPTPESIAARLGLPERQVRDVTTLFRERGFLRENESGGLERTERNVRFPTGRSFASVRKYHRSVLQKAREELAMEASEEQFQSRMISGLCVAGSSKKLAEARLILEEALYRAANLLANAPDSDELYQINLQLFPLSKPRFRPKK